MNSYIVTRWDAPPAQTVNVQAEDHSDAAKKSGFIEPSAQITVDDGRLHIRYSVTKDGNVMEQSLYGINLVGTAEAATILGCSRQHIGTSLARGKFPEPYARVAATPIWLREQIEEYKCKKEHESE